MYILLPSPIPSHPCLLKVLLHTSVLRVDLSALVPACHSAFRFVMRQHLGPALPDRPRHSSSLIKLSPLCTLHQSSTFHSSLLLVYILLRVDSERHSRVSPHSPSKCPSTPAGRSPSPCAPSRPFSSIIQPASRPIILPSTMPTAQTHTSLPARPSDSGLYVSPPGCGKQGCSLGIAYCCSRGTVYFAQLCCWGL